ncbi:EF hand, partial [Opisthorchis viverrini]
FWNKKTVHGDASEISARRQQELQIAFSALDENNSGHIEKRELRNALSAIGEGVTEKELDEMVKIIERQTKMDRFHRVTSLPESGSKIGFREFCNFMNRFGEDEMEKRNKLRGILRTWELNKNSSSAKAELHQALLDCGIEISCDKVNKIIAELDADQSHHNDYNGHPPKIKYAQKVPGRFPGHSVTEIESCREVVLMTIACHALLSTHTSQACAALQQLDYLLTFVKLNTRLMA